ncbi:hypothetical protein TrST_g6931 [Triparma strigata]|uniref:RBR-type E3 ubiquitin transferase n=1 Tax=Triparma strigata TaxID=1606541 RepID=A0A9W7BD79_9STRA|nr:hypothetical protein TrST_g6931 [Triparma strigata]
MSSPRRSSGSLFSPSKQPPSHEALVAYQTAKLQSSLLFSPETALSIFRESQRSVAKKYSQSRRSSLSNAFKNVFKSPQKADPLMDDGPGLLETSLNPSRPFEPWEDNPDYSGNKILGFIPTFKKRRKRQSSQVSLDLKYQNGEEILSDSDVAVREDMTTPLHLSCLRGCYDLVVDLLKLNLAVDFPDGLGRTSLHVACEVSSLHVACEVSPELLQEQQKIVNLFINGTECSINPTDNMGRTPLHYAASSGQREACKMLVENGAVLTLPDTISQKTPSELAAENSFSDLCSWLTCFAVFASGDFDGDMSGGFGDTSLKWFENVDAEGEKDARINCVREFIEKFVGDEGAVKGGGAAFFRDEGGEGWNVAELKKFVKKDYDVNSLMKMLEVVDWDVYRFKNEWKDGQFVSKHGINNVEAIIYDFESEDAKLLNVLKKGDEGGGEREEGEGGLVTCQVCGDEMAPDSPEWVKMHDHDHGICADCLEGYLVNHSLNRGGTRVKCPMHNCDFLVAHEIVVKYAGEEGLERMNNVDCDVFVNSASDLKYCKVAGCSEVVKLTLSDDWRDRWGEKCINNAGACCRTCTRGEDGDNVTAEGVYSDGYRTDASKLPLKAHSWCWECGGGVHWPIPCDMLQQWNEKLEEEGVAGDEQVAGETFEQAAHRLWLKANTKPCPACSTPIEKNDGCNHMTCSSLRCRHEFCWICLEEWDKHNTSTGGYYRCNKFSEGKVEKSNKESHAEMRLKGRKAERFIHYFSRWSAHRDSGLLEKEMASTVCERMKPVLEAGKNMSADDLKLLGLDWREKEKGKGGQFEDIRFIHESFVELLECRSFLQHSYALGYYRYAKAKKRVEGKTRSRVA